MDLYEEHGGHFDSSNSASSLPDLTHSMNSSLSSISSWDCSVIGTPPSTRRPSFDSVKLEDMSVSCHTPAPSRIPERYGSATGFYQVPNMGQKTMNSFQDQDMMFGRALSNQSFLGCQQTTYSGPMYSSFGSSDGLPSQYSSFSGQSISTSQPQAISFHGFSSSTPSLEMDLYSPASAMSSSPVSGGYVEPSQTTFVDTFDMSSPMGQVRSLQFESPLSEAYGSSPPGRQSQLQYFMSPSHSSEHHSSPTSTPSREPSQRQRTFQPLSSATALHRIQASRGSEPRVSRESRRRTGQKTSDRVVLPANVSIQNKAKRHCTWPGCQGRFQRQEHLKRHMKTHEDAPKVACQFCSKAFGRADNLKSHIKLHADPNKKSSRTDYFPKAQEVWEEMSRKSRKLGSQQ